MSHSSIRPKKRDEFIADLFDVSKSRRKTVLIVTHNSKIADCAEVVLHIKDGKLDSIVRNERPIPPEEIDW